uniref:Glutamine amidotransferase domain-containing protein n=1 Tax=viral metagenome TaxID=1070528 RepID=A0A6C0APM1_9ZZZZ
MPFGNVSFITKTLVDWFRKIDVEVVPIPFTTPLKDAQVVLKGLEGLCLQGGPEIHPIYKKLAFKMLDLASDARLPVFGICHGFQMMLLWAGAKSLDRIPRGPGSVLQVSCDSEILKGHDLTVSPKTFFHDYGVYYDRFNKSLMKTFRLLTVSEDRDGKVYASGIEGQDRLDLPFWGFQFHPELDRGLDWMADFFKGQMRGSGHPVSKEPYAFGKPVVLWTKKLCYVFPGARRKTRRRTG